MQVIAAYVDCGANDCSIRDQGHIEKAQINLGSRLQEARS
jgi:hypothetical protein